MLMHNMESFGFQSNIFLTANVNIVQFLLIELVIIYKYQGVLYIEKYKETEKVTKVSKSIEKLFTLCGI